MGLNSVMERLKTDTPEGKRLALLAQVEPYWPTDIDPATWNVYRSVWAIQKRLKCSMCEMAQTGRCKRGELRKAAKAIERPCFRPHTALLRETTEIVNMITRNFCQDTMPTPTKPLPRLASRPLVSI